MTDSVVAQLEQLVKDHLKGRLKNFKVLVEAEGLVLHGAVQSFYAKQLAQQLVMEAIATPIANNKIEVIDVTAEFGIRGT